MAEYEIRNNETLKRFETEAEGIVGFLEYSRKPGTIALLHTEVPSEIGGRGIAQALALYAFEFAKKNELKVLIYCPFVKTWIKRHPEWEELVFKVEG